MDVKWAFEAKIRNGKDFIKFPKVVKIIFGVSYGTDILRSKDLFVRYDDVGYGYKLVISRRIDRKQSINVFEFNGIPAFELPSNIFSEFDLSITSFGVSELGGKFFLMEGNVGACLFNGTRKYILLPFGFKLGRYYIDYTIHGNTRAIVLEDYISDNEIKLNTVGGGVSLPIEVFDDLDIFYKDTRRGVKCIYNIEDKYLILLKKRNDTN